jgi:CheY-like chemotaxis protein
MAKLVYVDDEAAIRKMVAVALRDTPHELLFARDGVEGLELIRRELPEVVFTDIVMPRMSGLELCEALRADPVLRAVPIIIVTASAQRSEIEHVMRCGATGFMAKPFSMAELREKVEQYLS